MAFLIQRKDRARMAFEGHFCLLYLTSFLKALFTRVIFCGIMEEY